MQASWLWRSSALVALALFTIGIAQSCAGLSQPAQHPSIWSGPASSADDQPSAPAPSPPAVRDLPPLPQGDAGIPPRSVSYFTYYFAWGNAIFDSSDGALFAGNGVTLNAPAGSLGWAIYPFNSGDFSPGGFGARLKPQSNALVYLAISDYEHGTWRLFDRAGLTEPWVVLQPGQYQNATGQFFIAVLVYGGSVGIDFVEAAADNGLPAGNSISGLVEDENGDPIAGVKISCDAPGFPETWTDKYGNYEFNGLADGSYHIEPDSNDTFTTSFDFTPAFRDVVVSGADEIAQNFDGSRSDIIGRVRLAGGKGVPGVQVTLNPGAVMTTHTAGDGSFSLPDVGAGNWTVDYLLAGYTFNPSSQPANMTGPDIELADVIATGGAPTYNASGVIIDSGTSLPLSGVYLTLLPAWQVATTDTNGVFTFQDLAPADYTVTPASTPYVFTPASRQFTIGSADVVGLDFSGAIPAMHTASGKASTIAGNGIPEALVKVFNKATLDQLDSQYTAMDGTFSLSFPDVPEIIVSISRTGMEFSPSNMGLPGTSNQTGVDFLGAFVTGPTYQNFVQGYFADSCLSCHSTTASNPVNPMLETYAQASASATACDNRIQGDTMPPGGGNPPAYQEWFADWISGGKPQS